ncbi:MAG: c-type cytochrome biogenesis protein CcsB [bacterium]|nr:c-type cytochrome biogenesis protein CcsB [bacterium]
MMDFLFFWFAIASYVFSSIAYTWGLVFSRDRFRRAGVYLAVGGLLCHTCSLGFRWATTGHGPYLSTYEILSSNVWIAVLFFLLFQWGFQRFANLGVVVMPLAFIMMGFALMGSKEAKALPPTLRSAWLLVHIIFAKLTVAAMFVAVAMAVFYLLKKDKTIGETGVLAKVPAVGVLDDYSYRLVAFGFVTLTIMVITGAIWANNSWGSYWSWEPTQTWSLLTWLVYGIYLHGRVTFRWKGTISAWYVILALLFSVVAFFVIPYFVKGLHSAYMVG